MTYKYKFNELLDFPCDQELKIILLSGEENKKKMIDALNEITGAGIDERYILSTHPSRTGKYISYTVRVCFKDAASMEKMYEELPKYDYVMSVL